MNPLRDRTGRWACLGAFAVGVLAAPLSAQPKIAITSPRDGDVVHPGSSVVVEVALSRPERFRMVAILLQGSLKGKHDLVRREPPYRFTVEIPRDIQSTGSCGITAIGVLPDQMLDSDPISIDIERPDPPLRLETQLRALFFDSIGDAGNLIVYGKFADGSKVDLTYSSLTKYKSGSQAIVKIDNNGLATATGAGKTSITVENNGAKVLVPVSVPHEE